MVLEEEPEPLKNRLSVSYRLSQISMSGIQNCLPDYIGTHVNLGRQTISDCLIQDRAIGGAANDFG
jgi:hypothetical protein